MNLVALAESVSTARDTISRTKLSMTVQCEKR